uniref:Uncharacterized protein n=1 Tax=Strix occidentalis caurina TaxID=311401 RepID=A0A8D0EVU3_STROC
MGLFQGDLINVLFTNKEPSNLSLNKISVRVIMQKDARVIYSSFCSTEINYLLLSGKGIQE